MSAGNSRRNYRDHRDFIQKRIDHIVDGQVHPNIFSHSSQSHPRNMHYEQQYSRPSTKTEGLGLMRMLHLATGTESSQPGIESHRVRSLSSSASQLIDIAFDEDTRWHGIHPLNVKAQDLAEFENLIPRGFRYARDMQAGVAWIPPLQHPRRSPGSQFIPQKRGTSAIPIVNPIASPRIQSVNTITNAFGTSTLRKERSEGMLVVEPGIDPQVADNAMPKPGLREAYQPLLSSGDYHAASLDYESQPSRPVVSADHTSQSIAHTAVNNLSTQALSYFHDVGDDRGSANVFSNGSQRSVNMTKERNDMLMCLPQPHGRVS